VEKSERQVKLIRTQKKRKEVFRPAQMAIYRYEYKLQNFLTKCGPVVGASESKLCKFQLDVCVTVRH